MNPLSYNLIIILSFFISLCITLFIIPKLIHKMQISEITGIDVNKSDKPMIPEMGGLAAVLGFSLSTSITLGIVKYFGTINETPVLVSISVICIAALIGLLDDVSILGRKEKAWFISLSSFPLIISQVVDEELNLLFAEYDFSGYNLIFWLFLVPLGISGCANAFNMSAGYNGLESGQMMIMSSTLLIICFLDKAQDSIMIILSSIFGSTLALFYYNKYPAKLFVGDVGTLGFGALIAAVTIMSGNIVYGVVCIIPTFYELSSTLKYSYKGIERRNACMNPVISQSGILKPPLGSEYYTLAFRYLSRFDINEKTLVNYLLFNYFLSGIFAIVLFLLFN